jgi:hypothetical protein
LKEAAENTQNKSVNSENLLPERQEVFFVRGFIAFEKSAWYHQSID